MHKLVHFTILAFLFGFNFFLPQIISPDAPTSQIIIWNVGQGQWATWVLPEKSLCLHSDFGGEASPIKKIKKLCEKYHNVFILSHFDLDHRSFARDIQKHLNSFCISQSSLTPHQTAKLSARQKKALEQFKQWKKCESSPTWWNFATHLQLHAPSNLKADSNNDRSLVALYRGLMTTGDLSQKKETETLKQFNSDKIHWWLLGHHGSKSSNSTKSIDQMTNLKMVFASARYARYKHPHPQVLARFKLKKIPLLRTEEWGNIHIELRKNYFTSSVELD